MKKLPHLILLFSIFSLTFCCKEKVTPPPTSAGSDQLPPITSSGQNTFGCEINGNVWLPEVPLNFGGVHKISASMNSGEISIFTTKKTTDGQIYQSIGLAVHSNLSDSMSLDYSYDISIFEMEGASATFGDVINGCEYTTDSINKGFIKFIRIDSIERIISGVFEYTVANSGCDTIKITNGRFDLQL